MPAPGPTRIVELDYDTLKSNLVAFLSTQAYFTDYDFTASGLDTLLGLLAYVDGYAAFYANMLAAEAFMDSATLRSSVVSHAQLLSYTTKSPTAATAVVNVLAIPTTQGGIGVTTPATIDKGTTFSASQSVSSTANLFTTTQSWSGTVGTGGTQTFTGLELREGTYSYFDYVADTGDVEQRFLIPSSQADVSLLEVYVQEGTDDTTMTQYQLADEVVGLTGTSKVYFLREVETGQFQVSFGDGNVGLPVTSGKVVRLVYFSCSGTGGNGFSSFTMQASTQFTGQLAGYSIRVTTTQASVSGEDPETIDQVKLNAEQSFSTRKRGLTSNDWRSVMLGNFTDIRDAKVWGGADDPNGQDGYIYIAVDPKQGYVLTQNRKDQIENLLLSTYRVQGLTPQLVDPNFVYLLVTGRLTLDDTLANIDVASVKSAAILAIAAYSSAFLDQFGGDYLGSILEGAVNASRVEIQDTEASVRVQQRLTVQVGSQVAYQASFSTPIIPGTITSTFFNTPTGQVAAQDDGVGNLQLYSVAGSSKVIVNFTAGTVDYVNGVVNLSPQTILNGDPSTHDLRFTATPQYQVLTASLNKIFVIDAPASALTAVVGTKVY